MFYLILKCLKSRKSEKKVGKVASLPITINGHERAEGNILELKLDLSVDCWPTCSVRKQAYRKHVLNEVFPCTVRP